MGNPFDPLNVILFLIAVFGFIRLRMILGRRTGNEDPLSQNKYSGQVERDIEKYSQNTPKAKISASPKKSGKLWGRRVAGKTHQYGRFKIREEAARTARAV